MNRRRSLRLLAACERPRHGHGMVSFRMPTICPILPRIAGRDQRQRYDGGDLPDDAVALARPTNGGASSDDSPASRTDYYSPMDLLLEAFDTQLRRQPRWPGVEFADRVIRIVGEAWAGVLWSDLDEETADAIIAREVAHFGARPEWEWKYYSYDEPSDLPDRLRAAGFVPEEQETLLVGRVEAMPTSRPLPGGVTLVSVDDPIGIERFLRISDEVFGERSDAFGRELLADIRAGRAAAVVAMADDRPISGGRIEFYQGTDFAGLYGGATVPDWRGRGVFRAIVAYRTALAGTRGFRYLQTDASEDSRPIFLRMGFTAIATTTPFIHP